MTSPYPHHLLFFIAFMLSKAVLANNFCKDLLDKQQRREAGS